MGKMSKTWRISPWREAGVTYDLGWARVCKVWIREEETPQCEGLGS